VRFPLDTESRILDSGIAIFYSAPRSYTGEDVLELQGHGGLAVDATGFEEVSGIGRSSCKDRASFTQRAFLNDKP
jgi:tRNA modification GTPase